MLRAEVDICLTLAMFGDAKPSSKDLEIACHKAAAHGMGIIEKLLLLASDGERQDLERKVGMLRMRLEGVEPAAPEVPAAAPPPQPKAAGGKARVEPLTRRELEVLRCIAEGQSTKQVAAVLGITFKTAACHRYRVMDKLGIHETASLVRYAIRQGMVEA